MTYLEAIEIYNEAKDGDEHELGRRYLASVVFDLAKEQLCPEADKQHWNMVNHFDPMEISESQIRRIIKMLEA